MYALQSLVVLALVLVCGYLSFSSLLAIFAMVRSGAPEDNFANVKRRLGSVGTYVFGHKGVFEDKSYGFMHLFYFYGFLILGIGHLELVIFGLTKFLKHFGHEPFLYRNFLPVSIIKPFEFSQDFMAITVVLMVSIALFRRIVIPKPRLLPRSRDAETILWLIGLLYVTFFLFVPTETAMRVHDGALAPGFLWHLPISSLLASLYAKMSTPYFDALHHVGFFSHLAVFLGFAVYIPSSKHLHLIAAGPNIYFRHFDEVAKPKTIDFEKSEVFGIDRVDKLSWKTLLDTFACTECGRCDAVCPAALTKKPLRPKKVLHDIKMNLRYENWPQLKNYKSSLGQTLPNAQKDIDTLELKTALINRDQVEQSQILPNGSYKIEGQIQLDEIWACTTCAACVDVCPVLIDSVPTALIDMRRHLLMMEAEDYPKELNAALRGMEVQGNPWGVGQSKRTEWAESLDVPQMKDINGEAEYLFWVGCAGATDDRAKKIQQSLVRILKAAQVDFAILGCEEKCTGDPARRMGNEYLFDMLAKENIETLSKYRFKKIFTSCPHCFNALGKEYRDYGTNFSVQHHSELINELLKDQRLPLNAKAEIDKITFHDPCYLGRYNDVYEAPREVIAAASSSAGAQPLEMSMNKRKSFCCGAGGGRMFMEEHQGIRINHERAQQAIATGAKIIATACPFCMTMMSDGIKDCGKEEEIVVKDIAEIVAEQLAAN